jgi:hypothetical protein
MSFRSALLAFAVVACGGAQTSGSGSGECPRGVIESQTQADMAVDMANRMCGAAVAERSDEASSTSQVVGVEGMMCTSFGELAETGRCGYPKDVASARRYYEHACAKHYQPACNALARLGR